MTPAHRPAVALSGAERAGAGRRGARRRGLGRAGGARRRHGPREMTVDFHFEAGQMQFVNNRRIAHKRTGCAWTSTRGACGASLAARTLLMQKVQTGKATLAELRAGGATQRGCAIGQTAYPASFPLTGNWTAPVYAVSVAGGPAESVYHLVSGGAGVRAVGEAVADEPGVAVSRGRDAGRRAAASQCAVKRPTVSTRRSLNLSGLMLCSFPW